VGKRTFNSAELWTHARRVEGPLQTAMINLKNCRQLGKALERIAKDGFAIERQGKDKYGSYYRLVYRY
jgi:hypothetical protein